MLSPKERIVRILHRQEVDRSGFWLGKPHPKALRIYKQYFGVPSHKALILKLKSELIWLSGESNMLNPVLFWPTGLKKKSSTGQRGLLAVAENIEQVEKIYWTRRQRFWFPQMYVNLKFAQQHNLAVFSGMGTYFWHMLLDYFGMEECFIKMYTHPEVVEAAVAKIVEIYLRANKALYEKFAERIDAVFFFNDLGTQLDTLVSPKFFRQFFLPGAKKLIDQAKSYKLKVAFHSCGSIEKFIPDLITAGVDILHPIQACAKDMGAQLLQDKYGNDLIFMGGLDTQHILPFATPEQVAAEVRRLKGIFGKHYILSPSHEALLDNVSGKNVEAMAQEALIL